MTGYGRGRPPTLTAAVRQAYLAVVAAGTPLGEAATVVGVTARAVQLAAKGDRKFAAARTRAQAAGRAARADTIPHGNYRYVHHGCRCGICRKDAAHQRAGAPDRARPDARILPLTSTAPADADAEPVRPVLAQAS